MNEDSFTDFAKEFSISRATAWLLFMQAVNLASIDKYPEYDNISTNFEKEKVYFILSNVVTEKTFQEMGRRFMIINVKCYLNYLLSETYPDIFKFEGDVKTKIKECYEELNNEKPYTDNDYDHDPYENFRWGDLGGEEAYIAYWNTD